MRGFGNTLTGALNRLYSAKRGELVGYGLDNLLAVANNILESRREHTRVFANALNVYGRKQEIRRAGQKKKNSKGRSIATRMGGTGATRSSSSKRATTTSSLSFSPN